MLADRVQESSTTTGTGSLTLAGATTGYRAFATIFGTGAANTFYYVISQDQAWEVGIGYMSSSTVLVRSTVLSSSNANALVSFAAGTKYVFNAPPSERFTNWRNQTFANPQIKNFSEALNALGSVSGATVLDLSLGNVISATITGATTFSLSNVPSSGAISVTIVLTNPGTNITWPSAVKWPQAIAPTLTVSGIDIVTILTVNSGSTWHAMLATGDSR